MRLEAPLDDVFAGRSHVRVLRALYRLPAGLAASAREIARRAGVSHPTASKALASLAEQGIVTRTRALRTTAFELCRTHVAVERLLPLFEWEERVRQEVIDHLRTQILQRAPTSVSAAYLFGSAATGEMAPASDLDVAVLHAPGTTESVAAAMEAIAGTVEQRFGNRLSFLLTDAPVAELQRSRRPGSRLWKQVLRDGIPILDPAPERAHG